MGKRKAAKKPETRRQQKLDVVFTCPFCNHEKSVDCNL
jgi:transcription elongation factor Elf1